MADLEKVIYSIERCICHVPDSCRDCAYDAGHPYNECVELLLKDALSLLKAQEPITGETSDGYHTFNELYHHRAVLFSVIVANYPDRAWKSKKHHDGTMYDNMFIVGIDTPDGQATYHYDVDPYWDMFKCRVLDYAPEWDGHTPTQAIERIGKLKAQEPGWISVKDRLPEDGKFVLVCNDDGKMMIAKYESEAVRWEYKYTNYDWDVWDDDEQGPVCYWAYLPEPPKEGTQK